MKKTIQQAIIEKHSVGYNRKKNIQQTIIEKKHSVGYNRKKNIQQAIIEKNIQQAIIEKHSIPFLRTRNCISLQHEAASYDNTVVIKEWRTLHKIFFAKLLYHEVISLECGEKHINVSNINYATVRCSFIHIMSSSYHKFSHIIISKDIVSILPATVRSTFLQRIIQGH